jgi:isopentenyl diphosphate isomerase/L-lactate dehydrogenase-like FMN-dependent dehydrogenase
MGRIEDRWRAGLSRRKALRNLAGFLAASPLLKGQLDPYRDSTRVPTMDELRTAFDFEAVAFARIPRDAFDYTAHGDHSEFTVRRNRQAFDWVDLIPRGVADVSKIQTATEILGTKLAYPIMLAPTAYQVQLHPEAEIGMRQGAASASSTPMIVSNVSSLPFDKIAAADAPNELWFQHYPSQEFDTSREMVEGAQASGCKAIAITVDQQASAYERTLHNRNLNAPPRRAASRRGSGLAASAPNPYRVQTGRLWIDWKFIDKIRPSIKCPMVIKGILTAEDARLCVEHGAQAVYVSNHGGRSMDYGPSTIEVLPEIAEAVGGRVPIIIDSGFRRGSDILKALALGATAVTVGRVSRWGLAAYGAPGAQRVLEILQTELTMAMAATGRPTLASIDKTLVRTDF